MANIDKWGPILGAHLERQRKVMRRDRNRVQAQVQEMIDSGDCLKLDVLLLECEPSKFPRGDTIHVADVCLGAGPGGGDYRRYELETSDSNDSWTLWWSISDEFTPAYEEWCTKLEEYEDSDGDEPIQPRLYSLQARAATKPDKPDTTPKKVAYEILRACWALEPGKWDTDLSLLSVDQGGILSKQELLEIRDSVIEVMDGAS